MAWSELVRLPDCPTCRQPVWVVPECGCGHASVSHDLNGRGERTACSSYGCGCRRFDRGEP